MNEEKKVTIFIAVPVDNGSVPQFWKSYTDLMSADVLADDYQFETFQLIGDSLITRARNNLTHIFLTASKADYMLFLDSDLEFNPADIKRVLDKRKEDAVVCGQYALKEPKLQLVRTTIVGETVDADGLIKVAEAGTGCMLIPRKVLEAIKAKRPDLEYTCDAHKDKRVSFFDVGVVPYKDGKRYMSEDWMFCRRVREQGFAVYVVNDVLLLHYGWQSFPLKDDELIEAIASRVKPDDEQTLQSYLRDIDTATRARWKTISLVS